MFCSSEIAPFEMVVIVVPASASITATLLEPVLTTYSLFKELPKAGVINKSAAMKGLKWFICCDLVVFIKNKKFLRNLIENQEN
jgi:hypothetical protein